MLSTKHAMYLQHLDVQKGLAHANAPYAQLSHNVDGPHAPTISKQTALVLLPLPTPLMSLA